VNELLQQALAEVERRKRLRSLTAGLFGAQRAFFDDGARYKAALCGRRGGKSHAAVVWLLEGAQKHPGSVSPYIAITRGHAERIAWQTLKDVQRKHNLGLRFAKSELSVYLANGSKIWLTGCPDAAHMETFRGTPYPRVVIDEAASFGPYLRELAYAVLIPCLADYRGSLAMLGSPGVGQVGLFHDIVHGNAPGWSHEHHWTVEDNPHMPTGLLEETLLLNGWTEQHPTFQREWLGRWVVDTSMLVYSGYTPACNAQVLPALKGWRYVVGLDLGASAQEATTAFAVCAFHDHDPCAYVIESFAVAGATASSIAAELHRLSSVYQPEAIVVDAGGLGGGYVAELQQRHALPVEPAEKPQKRAFQELLNGDLKTGRLRVLEHSNQGLLGEWQSLPWADERRLAEKDGHPNHHADATLYAWRRCRQYLAEPAPKPKPVAGSADWAAAEEIAMEQARQSQVEAMRQRRRR
jgi:hypothetical protein